MSGTDAYEKRFAPRGKVAHAVLKSQLSEHAPRAACGYAPAEPNEWLGDRTQDEREQAADMNFCLRCRVWV